MYKDIVYKCSVFIFCLCLLPYDVQGIWCFQCNSAYNNDCDGIKINETSSIYYKECEISKDMEGKEIFCRKLIQKIHDREGLIRVVRRCGWVIHPGKDCYTVRSAGHEETSCQCFSDGCNSASNLNSFLILITTSVGLSLISKYM